MSEYLAIFLFFLNSSTLPRLLDRPKFNEVGGLIKSKMYLPRYLLVQIKRSTNTLLEYGQNTVFVEMAGSQVYIPK